MFLHDRFWYLVFHRGCRCARTFGVLERECACEACFVHDVQCLFEVVVGFVGEADDDVGGDRGVGYRDAHVLDDVEVALLLI